MTQNIGTPGETKICPYCGKTQKREAIINHTGLILIILGMVAFIGMMINMSERDCRLIESKTKTPIIRSKG